MPIPLIAGGIVGGILSSRGASKAADTQSQAAMYAADLQKKTADESLAFQKQMYGDTLQRMAPYIQAGTSAVNTLSQGMQPGGQFSTVPQFNAPTGTDMQNDPGYRFRLQEGMKAIQSSAAAKGNIFSGGTMKAIEGYGQDYASNEYDKVFGRALTNWNAKRSSQSDLYNRYAGLAGTGQTAATTTGQFGANTANGVNNTLMNMASQVGQQYNNAAAARATGYVANGNIWSNFANNMGQLPMMAGMMMGG